MAAAPVPPAPNAAVADAPLSEVERIIDTFVAPSKLFTDIRRSAAWWAPWLLVSIFAIAFTYVVDTKVGFRKVTEYQIHLSPKAERQLDQLSPADKEKQISGRASFTRVLTYAVPVVVIVFIYLPIAGILFLVFKFALNAQLRFWQSIAIVAYAGLPGIIKSVLSIVALVAGAAPDSFDINNPVGTNPGYFVDASQVGAFMKAALGFADIFLIWTVVLCGLGFSIVGKVKLSTSMIVNFAVLAGFVLLLGGLATLGS